MRVSVYSFPEPEQTPNSSPKSFSIRQPIIGPLSLCCMLAALERRLAELLPFALAGVPFPFPPRMLGRGGVSLSEASPSLASSFVSCTGSVVAAGAIDAIVADPGALSGVNSCPCAGFGPLVDCDFSFRSRQQKCSSSGCFEKYESTKSGCDWKSE